MSKKLKIYLISTFITFCLYHTSYAQNDFLFLKDVLLKYNPQIPVREKAEGYSFKKALKNLENEWNKADEIEKYQILYKAIGLCHDLHATVLNPQYIEKEDLESFDTLNIINMYQSYERAVKAIKRTGLPLTVRYTNDAEYVIVSPIILKGLHGFQNIKLNPGDKIETLNSTNTVDFISKQLLYSKDCQYDFENKRFYSNYLGNFSFPVDSLVIVVKKANGMKMRLNAKNYISVIKKQFPKKNNLFCFKRHERILYDNKTGVVYIDLPRMKYDSEIPEKLKLICIDKRIKTIVVDIRNNPGGSDDAWMNLISAIIKKPVTVYTKCSFRNNKKTIKYLNDDGDEEDESILEEIPILNNEEYRVWLSEEVYEPDSNSISFTGNVYVIRDDEIYSSALAFTKTCEQIEQFITIGPTGGYLGGRGVTPMKFQLPESKLVFQLEPLLDMTGIDNIEDFYHQKLEIPIEYTELELVKRYTYNGDLFNFEYLKKHDPVFKKIMELEGIKF